MFRRKEINNKYINNLLGNSVKLFFANRLGQNTMIFKLRMRRVSESVNFYKEMIDRDVFSNMNNIEFSIYYDSGKKIPEYFCYFGVRSIIGCNTKLIKIIREWIYSIAGYTADFVLQYIVDLDQVSSDFEKMLFFDDINGTFFLDVYNLDAQNYAGLLDVLSSKDLSRGNINYNSNDKYSLVSSLETEVDSEYFIIFLKNYFNIKDYKFIDGKVFNKDNDVIYDNIYILLKDLKNIYLELGQLFPIEIYSLNFGKLYFDLSENCNLVVNKLSVVKINFKLEFSVEKGRVMLKQV